MGNVASIVGAVAVGAGGFALREYGQKEGNETLDRVGNAALYGIVAANVASVAVALLSSRSPGVGGIIGGIAGAAWGATHVGQ